MQHNDEIYRNGSIIFEEFLNNYNYNGKDK